MNYTLAALAAVVALVVWKEGDRKTLVDAFGMACLFAAFAIVVLTWKGVL